MMSLSQIKSAVYDRLWNIRNHRVIHSGRYNDIDKDIKIFVITHTDGQLPSCYDNRQIYFPLRAGNAINQSEHNEWLKDDVGDNISEYNILLNEMTGIYWVGKHYAELGSPQYVGFCHYRRYCDWNSDLLLPGRVIATSAFRIQPNRYFVQTDRDRFIRSEFIKRFANTQFNGFEDYLSSHTFYYSNLMLTDKETFFRYFNFIEKCMSMCIDMIKNKKVDLSGLSNYERRYYSFFLEEMTSYWLYHSRCRNEIDLYTTPEIFINIPNLETSVR